MVPLESKLLKKQKRFAKLVGELIAWAYQQDGYELTFGEALRPLRDRLAAVEDEIHGLERRVDELTLAMADPALYRNGDQARAAAHEKKGVEGRLAALLAEWEDLSRRMSEEARAGETR